MNLSDALSKANSIGDLDKIFAHTTTVQLGWMNDIVTVDGYKSSVTTDFIARQVMQFAPRLNTEDSKRLATCLAEKVFTPLRKLVEAPENGCATYQVFALSRIGWTPPPAPQFGQCVALKHAMVLGMLDSNYANRPVEKFNFIRGPNKVC